MYAPENSSDRAHLWDVLANYDWSSHALLCGDFNNFPAFLENSTHRTHILPREMQACDNMLSALSVQDLWPSINQGQLGFTFKHNAVTQYTAHLDRWFWLYAQHYDHFTCDMWVDHVRSCPSLAAYFLWYATPWLG